MVSYIENGCLEIGVKHFGAVLTSVKSQKSDFEFLWQGNPEIWNGQSPVLFPIIGRLLGDRCNIDGKEYQIIRHGLARHSGFDLIEKTDNRLVFLQREDKETLKCYPYKYELYMSFELDGNTLTVTHTVKNPNEKDMYFSLGAHPAFNCETGDKIVFEKKETAYCERIDRDSILLPEKELILDNSDTITIEKDTFDKDVMIFSGLNSKRVTLESAHSQRKISFEFFDAPFFSVWAKPDAPFVCLEPWYGINDSYEKMPDFAHKRGNVRLEAGGEFSFKWRATFRQELTNPNR